MDLDDAVSTPTRLLRGMSLDDGNGSAPGHLSLDDMRLSSNGLDLNNGEVAATGRDDGNSRAPGALSFGAMGLTPRDEGNTSAPGMLSFGAMGLSSNELPGTGGNSQAPGALSFGDAPLTERANFEEPLTQRANFEDDRSSVGSANSAATEEMESTISRQPNKMNLTDFPSDASADDMPTDRQPRKKFALRRTNSMGFHHRSPKHYRIPNATHTMQDICRYYEIVQELGK